MSGFVEWLEKTSEKNSKIKAVLRRSLAFNPGAYIEAYPYIEPFVKGESNSLRREAHYLVAGLWAMNMQKERTGELMTLGRASAAYKNSNKSESTERRFITLLDADQDQLSYRLRQMVALLKDYSIDFEVLLKGILNWNDDRKRTQNAWARDFYQNVESEPEITNTKEKNK